MKKRVTIQKVYSEKLLFCIVSFCFFFISDTTFAQTIPSGLVSASLKVEGNVTNLSSSSIFYQQDTLSYFEVKHAKQIAGLELELKEGYHLKKILEARDFLVLDTIAEANRKVSVRIEFMDLERFYNPRIRLLLQSSRDTVIQDLNLYAWIKPQLQLPTDGIEIFTGEELSLKLESSTASILTFPSDWERNGAIEYMAARINGETFLRIRSDRTGEQQVSLPLLASRPFIKEGKVSTDLGKWEVKITVKPSRINFLNASPTRFFFDPGNFSSEEIQLDYQRGIELNQLYRIEDRPESGGRLIAEWIPKSFISGNKVLGMIRFYSLHKSQEGYLYLKTNDGVRFMTNFQVYEQPRIEKLSVLRSGEDWTSQTAVYPGEEVEIRLEGKGLRRAEIKLEACILRRDTVRVSDELIYYFVKIPSEIKEKKVPLFLRGKITTFELIVREHQIPRDFDFVTVDYNGKAIKATDPRYAKPVVYPEMIGDINIGFLPEIIDQNKIHGKQYLRIEVKIQNARGDLLEFQTIEPIVVCPGITSPRSGSYDLKDCKRNFINLNDYLQHKTYDLEGWSKIELVIRHVDSRYNVPGHTRRLVFLKEKKVAIDLQVSFPTGMLVKRFNQSGVGNLTGISTSVIAQMSFYDPKRIGRLLPYQVGVGFIAVDAFSFNNTATNSNKDIGIVVIGSLYPIRKEKKFTFPIFAGTGYLLKNNTMFLLFGPGVQFNF